MGSLKKTWTFLNEFLFSQLSSLAARRFLIAAVSVFDATLLFVFSDGIVLSEENPVGLALIQASEGDVTRFVLVKLACTTLVILALRELERRDFLTASVVTNTLLAFQTWLIWYLCLSTYWTSRLEMILMAFLSAGVCYTPLVRTWQVLRRRKLRLRRA